MRSCVDQGREPTCPMCRGAVLLNGNRLRDAMRRRNGGGNAFEDILVFCFKVLQV